MFWEVILIDDEIFKSIDGDMIEKLLKGMFIKFNVIKYFYFK